MSPTGVARRITLRPVGAGGPVVELFVVTPEVEVPRPAILFIHGHQERPRPGGRDVVDNGALSRVASRQGFVAASLSQPGYGGSDGPPDYCGPATQSAVRAALDHLRSRPDVDPARLVLHGVSRGAIAAGLVAAEEPDLRALILVAGIYDLVAAYPITLPGIRANMERETGAGLEALAARSALRVARRIRASTLILHGRRDVRAPPAQAEAMASALHEQGTDASLTLFESGHAIPLADRRRAVGPFLARSLGLAQGRQPDQR